MVDESVLVNHAVDPAFLDVLESSEFGLDFLDEFGIALFLKHLECAFEVVFCRVGLVLLLHEVDAKHLQRLSHVHGGRPVHLLLSLLHTPTNTSISSSSLTAAS